MSFFDLVDLSDFTPVEGILFKEGETTEFFIKELKENPSWGTLNVVTDIQSGDFSGKPYQVKLSNKATVSARKVLLGFLTAFFTKDQLTSKNFQLSSLVGQRFKARAGKVQEFEGKKFQKLDSFVKLEQVASADDFSIM